MTERGSDPKGELAPNNDWLASWLEHCRQRWNEMLTKRQGAQGSEAASDG